MTNEQFVKSVEVAAKMHAIGEFFGTMKVNIELLIKESEDGMLESSEVENLLYEVHDEMYSMAKEDIITKYE